MRRLESIRIPAIRKPQDGLVSGHHVEDEPGRVPPPADNSALIIFLKALLAKALTESVVVAAPIDDDDDVDIRCDARLRRTGIINPEEKARTAHESDFIHNWAEMGRR